MMKEKRKFPNRVFSNTYGRGSNKVLNGTVQEQLDWFNGQKSLVQTWMDNIDQKIRELNAQKTVASLPPEELVRLLALAGKE